MATAPKLVRRTTPAILGIAAATLVPSALAGWAYWGEKDPMGRGDIQFASAKSATTLNFDFPYGGPQHATLVLRTHPQHGKDVMLQVERGQFLCRIDGCSVLVRFDEGKPERYSASGPSDLSTTVIFIRNFDRFVAAARKAKVVRIEAEFYQSGSKMIEFPIADLGTWPIMDAGTKTPAKKK